MPKKKPSRYGIHKRKFGRKVFRSYGAGGFYVSKTAARSAAKLEREYGSEVRVVKLEGGWRVFLRG